MDEQSVLARARAMHEVGDFDGSIDLLRESISAGNSDGEVLLWYARALSQSGRSGRTAWALDTAMEDPEWIVPAAHQLALIAYQSGNYELSLQTLERLERDRPPSDDPDLFADMLRARALLGTRRHYEEALEVIDAFLEQEPENETAIRLKAIALLGLDRVDEAAHLIASAGERTSTGSPHDPSTEPDAALEDLRLDVGEGDAYWCAVRARFERESGDRAAAETTIDACLEREPAAPVLVGEAVELYGLVGQSERVLAILERAYEADPSNRDARLALASQHVAMGEPARAEAVFRKATESLDRFQALEASIDLAVFLVNAERVPEALDSYEKAFSAMDEPPSPELLFAYAEALIFAGRYDDALRVADETPVEVHAPMLRGRVAFERADFAAALSAFEVAAIAWPNNAPIRYYLARSAEALGEFDRAIEEYRHAIRSDPSLSGARARLVELHIAEGRARHALAVLQFSSPRQQASPPTPEEQLLQVELQFLLGRDPDLNQLAVHLRQGQGQRPRQGRSPSDASIVQAIARGLQRQAGAEAVLERLAALETESLGEAARDAIVVARVDAALALDRTSDALEIVQAAGATTSDRVSLQLAHARALARGTGRESEASAIYQRILAANPTQPDALHGLASMRLAHESTEPYESPETAENTKSTKTAETAKAIELAERALMERPGDPEIVAGLVDALVRAGRRQEGITHLRRHLTRDAPYDGTAALQLALLLESEPNAIDERKTLAHRAVRFGAGEEAARLLAKLDPEVEAGAEGDGIL